MIENRWLAYNGGICLKSGIFKANVTHRESIDQWKWTVKGPHTDLWGLEDSSEKAQQEASSIIAIMHERLAKEVRSSVKRRRHPKARY